MALERKDVRAKMDPEWHTALVRVAESEGMDIGEFVETELLKIVRDRLHKANVLVDGTKDLGLVGQIREFPGNRKAGA